MYPIASTKSLLDVLVEEVAELLSLETQLINILPEMIDAASDPGIKTAFSKRLMLSNQHFERMERVSDLLGAFPFGEIERPVVVRIADSDAWIKDSDPNDAMDPCLISAAIKVEHYLNACYLNACIFARHLGLDEVASLLEANLQKNISVTSKEPDLPLALAFAQQPAI